MTPFLSVITINKNNAAGLRNTIQSVLTQTGLAAGDLEYIIIDGKSADISVDIIKKYDERQDLPHKITYWTSEEDTGIYNAMNKGIRAAHGEYVAILNSGDSYTLDALTGLKEIAKEHTGEILYGAINYMKNGVYDFTTGRSADYIPTDTIAHPASFIPLAVYNAYGLYDESFKIAADYELFSTLKGKGVPFFFISKIIADFDGGGISCQPSELLTEENTRIRIKHGVQEPPKPPEPQEPPKPAKKPSIKHKIKKLIKMFLPYGLVRIVQKAKKARKARHK